MSRRSRQPVIVAFVLATIWSCAGGPKRVPERPAQSPKPTRLNVVFADRLDARWSLDYMQIYANGWLIWQGQPDRGSRSIATDLRVYDGEQELRVRAVATPYANENAYMTSKSRVFTLGSGQATLEVTLDEDPLRRRAFDVKLSAR